MSLHVAVIDDDPGVQKLLQRVVTRLPGSFSSAMSAGEIPAALSDPVPSVVLLDLNIPGLDHQALLRLVGNAAPGIRAIILSGEVPSDVEGLKASAQAHGVEITEVLMKPVDLSDLRRAIQGD